MKPTTPRVNNESIYKNRATIPPSATTMAPPTCRLPAEFVWRKPTVELLATYLFEAGVAPEVVAGTAV